MSTTGRVYVIDSSNGDVIWSKMLHGTTGDMAEWNVVKAFVVRSVTDAPGLEPLAGVVVNTKRSDVSRLTYANECAQSLTCEL